MVDKKEAIYTEKQIINIKWSMCKKKAKRQQMKRRTTNKGKITKSK